MEINFDFGSAFNYLGKAPKLWIPSLIILSLILIFYGLAQYFGDERAADWTFYIFIIMAGILFLFNLGSVLFKLIKSKDTTTAETDI